MRHENKKMKIIQTILNIAFLCLGAVLTGFVSSPIHKLIILVCLGIIGGLIAGGLDRLFLKRIDAKSTTKFDKPDENCDDCTCT